MLLARLGLTESLDFLGTLVGDNDVLDGMALFLTTVVLPLPLLVLGPLDRSLRAINDEFQTRTLSQNPFNVGGFAGR